MELTEYFPFNKFQRKILNSTELDALYKHGCLKSWLTEYNISYYSFDCSLAEGPEIRTFLENVKVQLPSTEYSLEIGTKQINNPATFTNLTDNIISLTLSYGTDFNCDSLKELSFISLLKLHFNYCSAVTINKHSLAGLVTLRILRFDNSEILFLEEGTFDNLLDLMTVAFDNGLDIGFDKKFGLSTYSPNPWRHLWRLHCSKEYMWLRRDLTFRLNKLIQERKSSALYNLPMSSSEAWSLRDIFYPVDCAKANLTGDVHQMEFSVNDHETGITVKQCWPVDLSQCYPKQLYDCSGVHKSFYCSPKATENDLRKELQDYEKKLRESETFELIIANRTALDPYTFLNLGYRIWRLNIFQSYNFNCDVFEVKYALFQNLRALVFQSSISITIRQSNLKSLNELLLLSFKDSTIILLEQGALESLPNLMVFALDYDPTPTDDVSKERSEYLTLMQCSEEYIWLRQYLDKNPELVSARKAGAVYNVSAGVNPEWGSLDLKNTVDCTKGNTSLALSISIPLLIIIGICVMLGLCYLSKKRRNRKVPTRPEPPTRELRLISLPPHLQKLSLTKDNVNIDFRSVVGRGQFATVYKGTAQNLFGYSAPMTVAIKIQRNVIANSFMAEIELMGKMDKHLNIVNLLGVMIEGDPMILLELCSMGDLKTYLEANDPKHKQTTVLMGGELADDDMTKHNNPMMDLTAFCYQISRGMEHLASYKIVHRDIAARNMLLDDKGVVKVADFGMSQVIEKDAISSLKIGYNIAPVKWMSPEAIKYRMFSEESDVWSFGICMWEIFSWGQRPFSSVSAQSPKQFLRLLGEGYQMPQPMDASIEMYEVMKRCWNLTTAERPTFATLRQELQKFVSIDYYLNLELPYQIYNSLLLEEEIPEETETESNI